MLVERPPLIYRMIFPETVWRIHKRDHTVYLTFDDGPIPEVTPWVLDTLDRYAQGMTRSMTRQSPGTQNWYSIFIDRYFCSIAKLVVPLSHR